MNESAVGEDGWSVIYDGGNFSSVNRDPVRVREDVRFVSRPYQNAVRIAKRAITL